MRRPTGQFFTLAPVVLCAAGCGALGPEEPVAFIDINLPLNALCEVDRDDDRGLPTGQYDINPGSGLCGRDYDAHLRIVSYQRPDPANKQSSWSRTEPVYLQVYSADVTLKTRGGTPLVFVDPPLPNPFTQVTGVSLFPSRTDDPSIASFSFQVIPKAYAASLTSAIDQTVVADIQFQAFANDYHEHEELELEVFSYPIEICDGCLTACASETAGDAIPGGACAEAGGQDGRVCHDTGC